jgi:hypothetical protein
VLQDGKLTPLQKASLHNGRVYKAFPIKGRGSGKELVASRFLPGGREVKVFYGPGIVPMLGKEEHRNAVMEAAVEKFKTRFEHHLAFVLNKL